MANKQRGYYTVEMGGKERTLHFSMNFWANFTDMLGISLDNLADVFTDGISLSTIRTLIYSGLLAYDQEEGNPVDYNEYKVGMWLEDFSSDKLEDIVNCMLESRILGNDLNAGLNRNVKKTTKAGK
jgi:hypothetical protein